MAMRDSIEETSFAAECDFADGRRAVQILMAIPITMLSGLELSVFERHDTRSLLTRWVGN
jgi:hypothetical protein